jgi:hypothetical protein
LLSAITVLCCKVVVVKGAKKPNEIKIFPRPPVG